MTNPFIKDGEILFPYQATRDICFIWREEAPEKLGSFIIPEEYREKHRNHIGQVLSIGRGSYIQRFKKYIPTTTRVGDYVIYDSQVPWNMTVKNHEGKEFTVYYMGERDLSAVIQK